MEKHERSKSSLEGLEREDVPYLVDRILERDEDHKIEIEPLENSYALEWEPLEKDREKETEFYDNKSKFDRLRNPLLHSSPRRDDPKYKDIMDRRLSNE